MAFGRQLLDGRKHDDVPLVIKMFGGQYILHLRPQVVIVQKRAQQPLFGGNRMRRCGLPRRRFNGR